MRILVVGAGSVGGYFGGRLLNVGRDVTFFVRPARAAALERTGLVVKSAYGDVGVQPLPMVTPATLDSTYDVILLSCKAYDLEDAISSFAPAVGPKSAILPMLNGMRHLDALEARFGADRVLGGWCGISAVLNPDGHVLHLNKIHELVFGERDGAKTERIAAIESAFANAGFDSRRSDVILHEMWEKWVLIATGAGSTCLMRSTIGDIVSAGATDIVTRLLDECAAIAGRNGFPPREPVLARIRALFTAPGSSLTASMFRDIESHSRVEAEHIIGDLLARGGEVGAYPLLSVVHAHLRTYEVRRIRESTPLPKTPSLRSA